MGARTGMGPGSSSRRYVSTGRGVARATGRVRGSALCEGRLEADAAWRARNQSQCRTCDGRA
eukprot:2448852-Rhodomonas_salina.4